MLMQPPQEHIRCHAPSVLSHQQHLLSPEGHQAPLPDAHPRQGLLSSIQLGKEYPRKTELVTKVAHMFMGSQLQVRSARGFAGTSKQLICWKEAGLLNDVISGLCDFPAHTIKRETKKVKPFNLVVVTSDP